MSKINVLEINEQIKKLEKEKCDITHKYNTEILNLYDKISEPYKEVYCTKCHDKFIRREHCLQCCSVPEFALILELIKSKQII
jgi:hypothetical protein